MLLFKTKLKNVITLNMIKSSHDFLIISCNMVPPSAGIIWQPPPSHELFSIPLCLLPSKKTPPPPPPLRNGKQIHAPLPEDTFGN